MSEFLSRIPSVIPKTFFASDDDEEDDGEEGGRKDRPVVDEEGEEGGSKDRPVEESKDDDDTVKAEGEVKDEPGTKSQARKEARERTPSTELHVYTIPELMKFKKEELMAETVYLEGNYHEIQPFFRHQPHS